MKQYFTYDDPLIGPSSQSNSPGNSPNPTPEPQNLFTELPGTEDIELVHDNLPDTSRNIATAHVDELKEILPLPDLTETQRQQQKIKDIHNIDNQLDIITTTLPTGVTTHNADNQPNTNTLPNCVTNHGKRKATHSVEKETPANDHTPSDRVINRGKQSCSFKGNKQLC